tara:strand:+ start:93 stop:674 length:582 start_codon:yes stop_codon:yes gene_type:complete
MEPYDAYRYYMAIKLHFETDDYDAPKYNFKTSVKPQSFWKRKDKYHFAKVGKKFDKADELVQFYVSQFTNENKWIGDMLEGDQQYADWQKKNQSLSYIFQNDINTLAGKVENFDDLFSVDTHPLVVKEYLSDNICLETVVILDKLTNFMRKADKQITETIVWPDVSRLIRKYKTFVSCDLNKMKKIVLQGFTS